MHTARSHHRTSRNAVRAGGILFLSGASATLALAQVLVSSSVADFAGQNEVELSDRIWMLASAVLGGVLLLGASYWLSRTGHSKLDAVGRLERFAEVGCPGIVLAFVPSLFTRSLWDGRELQLLITVAMVALVFEQLLRRAMLALPASWKPYWQRSLRRIPSAVGRWLPLAVVLCMALYYFVSIGRKTLLVHEMMMTLSSDLAEFDNLFFNALHGHPFRSPAIEGDLTDFSALKVHAEFGLYLLLPFYAIRPGPEALLLIQTGIIALTSLPIYLLASRHLGRAAGALIACIYLSLPVVQRPNFYDFHFTPLGMFLVSWVLYALDREVRPRGNVQRQVQWALWIAFVLALGAREDISIGLCVLGLFTAIGAGRLQLGLVMATVSASYFAVVKFGLMPAFGRMWFDTIYEDLKAPGTNGFQAVVLTLLSNPIFVFESLLREAKLLYVLHMSVPVLGLWLRRPILLLAALPGFASTLLVTNRPPMYESTFQYTYLWVPYVVGASILGLAQLRKKDDRAPFQAAIVALAFAATVCSFQYGVLFGADKIRGGFSEKTFVLNERDEERIGNLRFLIAKIPPTASVAATERVGPHVSTRLVLYSLKFTLGENPDFLLIDAQLRSDEKRHVRKAVSSGYGVIERKGDFMLLARGARRHDDRTLRNLLRSP